MINEMDIHQQAFREEAHELLAELETSLLEWEKAPHDSELIGRIFRAMHTIKGSGAMFGFDDIAEFTHEVETALDLVRSGQLAVTSELIDLTLAARDQIKAMVDAVDDGEPPDEEITRELERAFAELNQTTPEDEAAEILPEEVTGITVPEEDTGQRVTYRIRFRPFEDIFLKGTNPIGLLNELRELGETIVMAHLDAIPSLEDYVPDASYTYWDIILTTGKGIDPIKDVFLFVEDDSELSVDIIDTGGRFELDTDYQRIGELLVERGDLTPEDLESVVVAKPRLGEMLVEAGMVTTDRVESALVEQQHIREVREKRNKTAAISSIRVPATRLDKLVDLVGEMVTVQARLSRASGRLVDDDLLSVSEEVERLTAELRDNAMSTRMVPIGTLTSKFKRLVRDLSQELGKEVEMQITGEETELDKTVIDRLNDPLIHLIRNSIDHGIETPELRIAAGKPRQGKLHVSAVHSGANVLIGIMDDGAGLDLEAIKAKAVEKGLTGPDTDLPRKAIYDFIFAPGFSTSRQVTGVSGRGVGMDVVKKNIEDLKGTIDIDSTKGTGTEITLKLPLTLAIIDGLLVSVGQDYYVIPVSVIKECVELTRQDVAGAHGRSTVVVRDELVPYIRLRDRFSINGRKPEVEKVVVVEIDSQSIGFVVDKVIGDHQTVIKSLGPIFKQVTDISGATILGDGSVALILDVFRLARDTETEGYQSR